MNIDIIRERVLFFGTIILSIILSIYGGKLAANGQYGTIGLMAVGALVIFVTLVARERVWIGVLMTWSLTGRLEVLPLPFSWKDLGVLITAGIVVMLIAFRVIRTRPKFSTLDALLWINVLWLAFAFIRNPTGTAAAGSDRIGGRPYFDCLIALIAYWVLSRASGDYKLIRKVPWLVYAVVAAFFTLNLIVIAVPQLAPILSQIYSSLDMSQVANGLPQFGAGEAEFKRYEFFKDVGVYGVTLMCAYYVPMTLLSPIWVGRFLCFGGLMLGLLLSGFRSFIMYAGGMFILGSYFYRGLGSAVKALAVGVCAAFILMLGHGVLYQLPFAAQRALAFIPESLRVSKLDTIAVEAGTATTSWRVEMWIDALSTDLYIKDKIYGDGFGVTKQQATEAARMLAFGGDYRTAQQIVAMYGDFHSGPVSTIRVAGYIGLGLMAISLLLTARRAAKMIRAAKGTPLFQPALYIGMPLVFEPFWFFFVFGGYTSGFVAISLGLGSIKMIENSLERWREENAADLQARQAPELDLQPKDLDLPELELPALRP